MTFQIKQSVETELSCVLIDDTDFKSPETGVAFGTPTVRYAKEGDTALTTLTLSAGNWDEIGVGIYAITFTAAILNTVGSFVFVVTSAGILPYYGLAQISANLKDDLAKPGDAMALTSAERTTLAGVVDGVLTAAHSAGSWTGSAAAVVAAIADAVWTELLSDHVTALNATERAADVLQLIRKLANNRQEVADGNTNNVTTWDDDDLTILRQGNMRDVNGNGITNAAGVPSRRSRGL